MSASSTFLQISHFFVSSLLVFSVTALLIEGGLSLFRVKNPRLRVLCRLLPIMKLPLDLLLYKFSNWNFFTNFNPFSCQFLIEEAIVKALPLSITEGIVVNARAPLASVLSHHISEGLLQAIVGIVAVVSAALLTKRLLNCFWAIKQLNTICLTATPIAQGMVSGKLWQQIDVSRVKVLVSNKTQMPFATRERKIVLSETALKHLSQEELEAVIGHELAHVRWKDPLAKLLSRVITSVFWWIPTKWWLDRLEGEQELASDAEVLDHHALASAILKMVQQPHQEEEAFCHLATRNHFLVKRFAILLRDDSMKLTLTAVIGAIISSLALVVFWVC